MTDQTLDAVVFDEDVLLALAESAGPSTPGAHVRASLLSRLTGARGAQEPPPPPGFAFRFAREHDWLPHPVPGIRMKVLSRNDTKGYATLLLDVAPGTRFPAHHHGGDEECYVVSGSLFSCGRRFTAGDFLHADADTDHGELFTEEGTTVILVVSPEDYMPAPAR